MINKIPVIISILFHTLFFILLFKLLPNSQLKEPEQVKINIELIAKKDEKELEKEDIKSSDVDIVDNPVINDITIDNPESGNYLEEIVKTIPDLVVRKKKEEKDDSLFTKGFSIAEFEESLSSLLPDEIFIENDDTEDNVKIEWEGEKRDIINNSNIDFSKFPKDSFTGVGVHVEFMVNTKGEVYGAQVLPPGSGSMDFDILITQYVSKFTFNKSDQKSKGEVYIVYKE